MYEGLREVGRAADRAVEALTRGKGSPESPISHYELRTAPSAEELAAHFAETDRRNSATIGTLRRYDGLTAAAYGNATEISRLREQLAGELRAIGYSEKGASETAGNYISRRQRELLRQSRWDRLDRI